MPPRSVQFDKNGIDVEPQVGTAGFFIDIGVKDQQKLTPEDAIQLHKASRKWLEAMLAEPFDGKTVVVTHHAPSSRSVHPRYAHDLLTPAFASNLENLMHGDRVPLWIHGHMHESFDYEIYGTRVLCNPRGYAPRALNPDFKEDLVVEVSP